MLTSLSTYGYLVVFLYSLGGGMVAIIAAGVLAHLGKMDITVSIVLAAAANTIGDTLLFYVSRYNRAAVMPYLAKHKRKLAFSQILFKKHGNKIIFFKKFIYGLKTLVPLAIGLTKYSFAKFSVINIVSAVVWAVLLGLGSFYAGEAFERAGNFLGENGWLMPVGMLSLLATVWIYLKKATTKKRRQG